MNRKVTAELHKSSLVNLDYNIFNYFNVFTSNDYLAEIFMDCCVPFELHKGSEYANTPIGALFNLSILPKNGGQPYEHFTSPLDHVSLICICLCVLIKNCSCFNLLIVD